MIQAIETKYKGYNFRSRLEARWAVFFDALGIKWEYEKEGYDLGALGWYLPDFWFPDLRCWVEIKPNGDDENARAKCAELSKGTQTACLLIEGSPGTEGFDEREYPLLSYRMFLFGGEPWDLFESGYVFESTPPWDADGFERLRRFLVGCIAEETFLNSKDAERCTIHALDESERRRAITLLDYLYYERRHGRPHFKMKYGRQMEVYWMCGTKGLYLSSEYRYLVPSPEIRDALNKAKSARFEHGANPLPGRRY